MKFGVLLLKLTLNVSLLFGMTSFFISEVSGHEVVTIDDLVVQSGVKPMHYDVMLTLNPKRQIGQNMFFEGECHIELSFNFPKNYIILHAHKSYVKVYSVGMFAMHLRKRENRVNHFTYIEKNKIEIYFAEELHGNYTLELYFDSQPNNEEFFKMSYENGTNYIMSTHLRPTRTSALFPCWDDPRIKATFNITVVFEKKYTALSNMPEQHHVLVDKPAKNMIKLYFHETSKISTYDIAIVIFDKYIFFQDVTWYKRNVTKYTDFAQIIANKVTQYLKFKFLNLLPFKNANHIAIPGFPHDAMTKLGLNIFREEAILYNIYVDNLAVKINVARLVARVVVHERLNNLISPVWWFDLWLNEAIAMLLGQNAVNELFPHLRLLDLFVVQFHQESLRLDIDRVIGPVIPIFTNGTNINTVFSFSYYIKGPVVLYMLQRILTDDIFWKGIKKYFTYKTASMYDFCTAMQIAVNESALPEMHKFDVEEIMNVWSKQTSYPVLNVIRYFSFVRIEIDNVAVVDDMFLPITITAQSNLNFKFTANWQLRGHWLKKKDGLPNPSKSYFLNLTKDDWIIVNLQQTGYYRVKYDIKNWQKIAKYLDSDNYVHIDVLNRAQMVDDAFHFVMTGRINMDIFVDLIKYLSRERDYVAWYPMIKNLEYMSSFFAYEESTFIKEKIQKSLSDVFSKIAYKENLENDVTNFLKQEVAKWACFLGSYKCKNDANVYLELEYRETHVSPWWKDWVYCQGLTRANFTTWRKIFDRFLNETDNKMLKFLACPENPNIIRNYMDLIIYNKKIQDRINNKGIMNSINIFHSIVARHTKNIIVLDYMLKHFDRLIPSEIGSMVAITDIINHVYSPRHIYMLRMFVRTHKFSDFSLVASKMLTRLIDIDEHKKQFLNFGRWV